LGKGGVSKGSDAEKVRKWQTIPRTGIRWICQTLESVKEIGGLEVLDGFHQGEWGCGIKQS
jgi:hypothetical protein